MKRRILSIITALALCLSLCPTWAFATEADPSLCKHHPAHTAECGYIAPTEGHDCGHQHTAECYTLGVLPDADSGDPYEVGADTENLLNCQHSHDSACGYVEADPGAPCGYVCRICPIEDLIAALPEQVTEDNADDVRAQLDEILALYRELDEGEQGQLDLSRCYELQEALDNANAPVQAAEEITINNATVKTLTAEDGDCPGHTFTGTAKRTMIYVASGVHNVTFSNLSITGTANVGIAPGATMNLTIEGTNTIQADYNLAGIYVPVGATLAIQGAGSLDVSGDNSAGIGGAAYAPDESGSDGDPNCGTVEINGGTITATGGSRCAGIGGGTTDYVPGNGGTVTINDGTVTAKGGSDNYYGGAGIGGAGGVSNEWNKLVSGNGGTLTINGGTVNLTAGTHNPQYPAYGFGQGSGSASGGTCELTLTDASYLDSSTTLDPNGKYTINGDPTADMIVVPEGLVYTGQALDVSGIKIDDTKTGTGTYFGQTFTVNASADGWVLQDLGEVVEAGEYTAVFKKGDKEISKTFTVAQSGTQFVGDGEVKTYNGDTLTTSFSAGDTIKVVATPTPTGAAPQKAAARLRADSTEGQMVVFVNNTQVSEPAGAGEDGSYTMTVSAAEVLLAAGGPKTGITLTAKFIGNDNMADGAGTATVNITAAAEAEKDGAVIGYYGESNLDKAFANDGATVTLLDNVTVTSGLTVKSGQNITFEGRSFTLAQTLPEGETADMTHAALTVEQGGTLTVKSGIITSQDSGLNAYQGTLYVEGGEISGEKVGLVYGADCHISGGKLTGDEYAAFQMLSDLDVRSILLNFSDNTADKHYAYYQNGSPYDPTGAVLPSGTFTVQECQHTGVEATNNNDGTHSINCPYCGHTGAAEICAYGEYTHNDTSHTRICKLCGYQNVEAHEIKCTAEASGTVIAVSEACKTCGYGKDLGTVTIHIPKLVYGDLTGVITAETTLTGTVMVAVWVDNNPSGDTVIFPNNHPTMATLTGNALLSAGEHKINININISRDDNNYVAGCSLPFTVDPAPLTEDMVTLSAENATYSGTAQKPALSVQQGETTLTEGTDYEVSYKRSGAATTDFTNAGTVNITVTGKGNYTGSVEKTYTIGKADLTVDGTGSASGTYGDKLSALTVSGLTAKLNGNNVAGTWKLAGDATPNVGDSSEYTATFTPTSGAGNYNPLTAKVKLNIAKAPLTATSAAIKTRPYQPTNHAAEVSAVIFTGLKNGETLALGTDYTATGAFADANAGENKSVTVTVTLAGTDKANNYQLSDSTCAATGTITKADPVVTDVSVSTPATIYESAALGNITLTHGASDTAGTVTLDAGQTLTVGPKEYNWTFTPNDIANYDTATGKISLTVERDTLQSIAVTTQPTKTTYIYGESFDKAGMVITATYASSATKDVTGEVQISPAELTVTTTELTITYQGKTVTQAITVGPKTVSAPTIELSPSSFVYDGAEKKPTVTVKDGTTVIPANEYTVGYSNNTNVGNATVTITNVAGNYTVSGTKTFAISAKPLTGAKVEVTGTFTYTGSAQEPTPTVTLDGKTLTANTDYTVTYADNTDVGTAKITVTGKGNYSGTAQGTFTIGRADLTVDGTGIASGTYGDKLSGLTVSGLTAKLDEATVTGTWKLTGDTVPNVGDSGEYTATFTPATGADNYNALTAKVTLNIAKANYSGTKTASTSAKFGTTGTYDLSALLPDGATAGTAATDSDIFEGTPAVSGKTLTYTLKMGATVGNTGTITVPVTSTNYNDFNLTITVTVTNKDVPTLTVSPITVTYTGQAIPANAIQGTAKVGDAIVPGTWAFASGEAVTNVADSGTKTVKFVPTDKETYAEATGTVVVTINKATPTGAPKYTAISASGKTLADAGLTAVGGTFNTEGTVAWTLDNTTEVTANTQYEWTFTPTDTANYNTLTGKITLWPYTTPVNPGGGGGYVPSDPGGSTLPVTTTGQGSTTTTTTTTAAPTASVSNGTATTTINTAMGQEIVRQATANKSENVVIAPSVTGSVTKAEVSIPASTVGQIGSQTSASLTVSTPVADVTIPNGGLGSLGSAGGTVTVTAEQVGNQVELTVTAGGQTVQTVPGGVTLTVPASNTTPGTVAVLVRPDGTRQVVRKSVADGDSVTIPLDGSAKLEIVDNSGYFADVPATSWAADAVAFASGHELFSGTAPGQFSPNTPMSRGMLAVVLHNLESNPAQALTGAFIDVDNSQWYAEGVAWAEAQGIIGGYGNGQFGPNDNITREQLAVMLWRYAGSPAATDRELHFADAHRASDWALEALRWATENGIINGKGGGILDPTGQATRAETAQMLKNFMESK